MCNYKVLKAGRNLVLLPTYLPSSLKTLKAGRSEVIGNYVVDKEETM